MGLAVHLVMRERRPDTWPGILIPRFAPYAGRVHGRLCETSDFLALVDRFARRPWWLGPLDELLNLVEYFVHHEDVRRAVPSEPRELPAGMEAVLWKRLAASRLLLRGHPARLVAPGFGARSFGEPVVTVTGAPGELALFCFGRQAVARVELDGPEAEVAALRAARLGV